MNATSAQASTADAARGPTGGALPPWAEYLVAAGRWAPSADNSQPWRFIVAGDTLALGTDSNRAGTLGADYPTVALALGACTENLVQAAEAAGFSDVLVGPEEGLSPNADVLRIGAPSHATTLPLIAELPLARRCTNRGAYKGAPLPSAATEAVMSMQADGARATVVSGPAQIAVVAELIRLASELRFQDAEIHRWLAGSLRFTRSEAQRGDGLDVRSLALPPGGGLLMRLIADWRRMSWLNRLGAFRLLARIEASAFRACSAIVIIEAAGWSWGDLFAAGRVMERAWIALNAHGLAVHPYYVLSDQLYRYALGRTPQGLESEAALLVQKATDTLELGARAPAILLRVGTPKVPAERSARLPIEQLVEHAPT